jgi:hypothetical protein
MPTMAAAALPRLPWYPLLVLRHTIISQHATQLVYIVKTRKKDIYYCNFLYYVQDVSTVTMWLQGTMPAATYGPSAAVPMQ